MYDITDISWYKLAVTITLLSIICFDLIFNKNIISRLAYNILQCPRHNNNLVRVFEHIDILSSTVHFTRLYILISKSH